MDTVLCDELLQEIFHRLHPPSSAAVSLVSRRWCRLLRSSTTSLSLHFPSPYNPTNISCFSTFLCHHPFLSSLSIAGGWGAGDPILLSVSSSCPNLQHLRFLTSPVSPVSLTALSTSCIHLSSIAITISRPLSFRWLTFFSSLKRLSLFLTNPISDIHNSAPTETEDSAFDVELSIESLSLCGILSGDSGLSFLWRNCKNIKKLQLKSCESLGDYSSFSSFIKSLNGLQELELRTCRSIVDGVLLKLAENCVSLVSLLIYDGGSKEGLLQFINQCNSNLKRLDFRLPLDLDNAHLSALSENLSFRGLVSLRLQSCCLVTGEGLKALGRAIGHGLEELALINCDVVERESGLLYTLGQYLKNLRTLDLSYNDMLVDKELLSILLSCALLDELKLRGCGRLSNSVMGLISRCCKLIQSVDIMYCCGIETEGVEFLVLHSPQLKRIEVERSKISEVVKAFALSKFMEIAC